LSSPSLVDDPGAAGRSIADLDADDLLLGALLRVPAQAVQRRLIAGLNAAGFTDLRLPHMAVLQYPGPDGVRPSELAERAGISKQAMNQLLHSLERLGYITRLDTGGRARVVRFTERGHAAWTMILEVLRTVEDDCCAELGADRFAQLKELLLVVWQSSLVQRGLSGMSEARKTAG
jgi:DNA-binding MarR family transcriptional regulator